MSTVPNSRSRKISLVRSPVAELQSRFSGHTKAIVIGINTYTHGIRTLKTARPDAEAVGRVLQERHGYDDVRLLIDEQATLAGLQSLLASLPDFVEPGDRLLFYFAGHGVADPAEDSNDRPELYLVPSDAAREDMETFLPMSQVLDALAGRGCQHLLIVLDCCFAGAILWSTSRSAGSPLGKRKVLYWERFQRYLQDRAYQVITSAAQNEEALDVLAGRVVGLRAEGDTHSPFAQALIRALETEVADGPPGRGDGVLSATELYQYLFDTLRSRLDLGQTPGLWTLPQHQKGEYVFIVTDRELRLEPAPALDTDHNPWLGLESYGQKDQRLFFGRDTEIEALAARVAEQPFVVVLGASGTGKSSLVKAGVLPALQAQLLPPMRPTDQPMRALWSLLRAEMGEEVKGLTDGDDALAEVIRHWAETHPGQRLVLTIDQCEELITLAGAEERERFLRQLARAVEQHPDSFRLIITLRSDFEPQLAQDTPLSQLWRREGARYVVPPMSRDNLRQVIEGPAAEAVLFFDPPQLVDELIDEVDRMPGGLPLLSYALSQLYINYVESRRNDRTLIRQDYLDMGRVVGSLRNRANDEYEALPDDAHRRTMARVMVRMLATEGGGELVRRRVMLDELEYPTSEENNRVNTVLDRLVNARLLVRGSTDIDEDGVADPYIEPAHDALVAAWDRLALWRSEAEAVLPLSLHRELTRASVRWDRLAQKDKPQYLWKNEPRLPQLQNALWPAAVHRPGPAGWLPGLRRIASPRTDPPADTRWLNRVETEFVRASVQGRAVELRRWVAGVSAVIVVLTVATIFAFYQRDQAQTSAVAEAEARVLADQRKAEAENQASQARHALSGQIALRAEAVLPDQPQRALLLALEALHVTGAFTETHGLDAERALRSGLQAIGGRPLTGTEGETQVLAVSPEGRWAVTARAGDTLGASLWDMAATRPMTPTAQLIAGLAMVLPGNEQNPLQQDLLGQVTQQEAFSLTPQTVFAFDPAGARLVAADLHKSAQDQSIVRVWDLKSEEKIRPAAYLRASTPDMTALALSPDGRWLAVTTGAGTVDLWDLDATAMGMAPLPMIDPSGMLPPELPPMDGERAPTEIGALPPAPVPGFPITPMVSTGPDFTFAAPPPGAPPPVPVPSFPITPMLSTGSDLVFADPTLGAPPVPVPSFPITPMLSTGSDLVFADPTLGAPPGLLGFAIAPLMLSLPVSEGPSQDVVFSPDGRWLLAVGNTLESFETGIVTQTVRLWSLVNGVPQDVTGTLLTSTPTRPIAEAPDQPSAPAAIFSPDGQIVAALDELVGISTWRLSSGVPVLMSQRAIHEGDEVLSYAFSPGGRWLLAITDGEQAGAFLWDLAVDELSIAAIQLADAPLPFGAVAFSPDDRWLAIDDQDQTTWLWDLRVPAPGGKPKQLQGHPQGDVLLSFTPDATWLTMAAANTVYAWRLSDFLVYTFRGHEAPVTTLASSPDSRQLFSASRQGGTTRLWDLANVQPAASPYHLGDASAVALSAEGRWLVAAIEGRVVRWDLAQDAGLPPAETLLERVPGVKALALSTDGHWLATSGDRGDVTLWPIADGAVAGQPVELGPLPAPAAHLAFSGDAHWLAAATDDSRQERVWLWKVGADSATPAAVVLEGPAGQGGKVTSLVPSRDGRWLGVSVDGYGTDLWRLDEDPATLAAAEPIYLAAERVVFTPDSSRLATAGNQEIKLHDLTTDVLSSEEDVLFSGKQGPALVSFNAGAGGDGRWLAASPSGTAVRLWDTAAADPLATYADYPGNIGAIVDLAVGPDGRWLVAGSDSALQLWDTRRPAQGRDAMIITPLPSDNRFKAGGLHPLAISGSGHWLITAQLTTEAFTQGDTNLLMWNLDLDELITQACRTIGRNFDQNEWAQFFRGDDYRATCAHLSPGD